MESKHSRWSAVLAVYVLWFVWTGFSKGFGVMLPRLQEDFDSSASTVGGIIAFITGICDFVGRCTCILKAMQCVFGRCSQATYICYRGIIIFKKDFAAIDTLDGFFSHQIHLPARKQMDVPIDTDSPVIS